MKTGMTESVVCLLERFQFNDMISLPRSCNRKEMRSFEIPGAYGQLRVSYSSGQLADCSYHKILNFFLHGVDSMRNILKVLVLL